MEQESELNLDKSQSRQAATQKATWDRTTTSRVGETFQWLLVPTQPNAQAPVDWQQSRLSGPDPLAIRACKKLRNDSQMVMQYAPTLLRQELDKIPLWRGNHVGVKQLVEDFARYPYLQRVRTPDVLLDSMRDGVALVTWRTDSFAFADGLEEAKARYLGLRGGQVVRFTGDAIGLLVKPEVAEIQLQAERPQPQPTPGAPGTSPATGGTTGGGPAPTPATGGGGTPAASSPPTVFFGSVKVDTTRISRDVASIANEIIQHLAALPDSEVAVTLEIQARVPGGVPDNVVRTVSENCRTLKFSSQHFEKE